MPLSIDVWNSLSNRGPNVAKTEMSFEQKKEYRKLNQFLDEKLKRLGIRTREYSFSKSVNGYKIRKLCNKLKHSACKSKLIITVDVTNGKCRIYLNKKCQHF